MSTLHIILASSSGLVLGYATAAHFGSRAKSLLESSLKRDQDRALKRSATEIEGLKTTVDDLQKGEENHAKLSVKLTELEKRAKELETERERDGKTHTDELARMQNQLEELQAQGGDAINAELSAAIAAANGGLDDILKALIAHEHQNAAVLADSSGIIIASAGDQDSVDRISAATSTLTSIPKQLDSVLPLGESFAYRLTDNKHAITGRSFVSAGDLIALTTIGDEASADASLRGALVGLRSSLE